MFYAVKFCQVQCYSLLEAFLKAVKASVTFHGQCSFISFSALPVHDLAKI